MIIAADWVIPVSSNPLKDHAVVTDGERISEIRPAVASDPRFPQSCLLPGLINTHTHLAYTAMRNLFDSYSFFSWVRKLTEIKYKVLQEADFELSTTIGVIECLRSGITTVADLSDVEPALGVLSGSPLRGIFYWEVFGVEKEQAEASWNDLQGRYPRFCAEYASERMRIGVSPHACYTVRPEFYRQIADWAGPAGIPVSFHAAESKEEEQFVARREGPIADFLKDRAHDWSFQGSTSLEHLKGTGILQTKPLIAHAVQASPSDLDLLSEHGAAVSHCPKSNAKFGHGIAPVCGMLQRDIIVSLGSDSAASNNRFDLFEEARFALLQQRNLQGHPAVSEQQMLEMMTIRGAEALGISDQVGSLVPGKLADMIVVRMPVSYNFPDHVINHLIHNTCAEDVTRTIIGGKEVPTEQVPDAGPIISKISSSVYF